MSQLEEKHKQAKSKNKDKEKQWLAANQHTQFWRWWKEPKTLLRRPTWKEPRAVTQNAPTSPLWMDQRTRSKLEDQSVKKRVCQTNLTRKAWFDEYPASKLIPWHNPNSTWWFMAAISSEMSWKFPSTSKWTSRESWKYWYNKNFYRIRNTSKNLK